MKKNFLTVASSIILGFLIGITGSEAAPTYRSFAIVFSAIEVKSYPDSTAYKFILQCDGVRSSCNLRRLTFEECSTAEDGNGEVMQVWDTSFSTNDESLEVHLHGDRSMNIKLTTLDIPYQAEFNMAISIDDFKANVPKITSFSGTLRKQTLDKKTERLTILRGATRPIERLKRKCPIGLIMP